MLDRKLVAREWQTCGMCTSAIDLQSKGSEGCLAWSVQVNTLLKGLEKIAASADIPMLVAGDFNSVPGSAAHTLLLKRGVEPSHPVRTRCVLAQTVQMLVV
jgi:hypothetical protein